MGENRWIPFVVGIAIVVLVISYSRRKTQTVPHLPPQTGMYRNEQLHIEISSIPAADQPMVTDYGKRIELNWNEQRDSLRLVGGYFYGKKGKLLTARDVILGERTTISQELHKEPTAFQFSAGPGQKLDGWFLDITETDRPHQFVVLQTIAAIQWDDAVYFFSARTPGVLNKTLISLRFTDANPPVIAGKTQAPNISHTPHIMIPPSGRLMTDQTPTFMVKVRQSKEFHLPTEFSLLPRPGGDEEYPRFTLGFLPGRMENVTVTIDGGPLPDIYGFAQYPSILCDHVYSNENQSTTYDPYLYDGSRNTEPFITKDECEREKASSFPSVILLAKPGASVSEGEHEISVRIATGDTATTRFTVAPRYRLPQQFLPKIQNPAEGSYGLLDAADNCPSGYYYLQHYLRLPLPIHDNPNILYRLAFPKRKNDTYRPVSMKFGTDVFDLFFPSSTVFYDQSDFRTYDGQPMNMVEPYRALYLPMEYLVYADGTPAKVWTEDTSYYSYERFEIYPEDISGRVYTNNILPWETQSWSGCDG